MKARNTKKVSWYGWQDDVFGARICVFIGETLEIAEKSITKALGVTLQGDTKKTAAAFCMDFYHKGAYYVVIVLDDGCSFGTIAHEALHAVNFIYKNFGVRADERNDEHAAYFLGRIVDNISELVLKRNKIKKNA